MAYAAVQRTREIGVRMARGATRGDVRRLVVGQGTRLATVEAAMGFGVVNGSRVVQRPDDPVPGSR